MFVLLVTTAWSLSILYTEDLSRLLDLFCTSQIISDFVEIVFCLAFIFPSSSLYRIGFSPGLDFHDCVIAERIRIYTSDIISRIYNSHGPTTEWRKEKREERRKTFI